MLAWFWSLDCEPACGRGVCRLLWRSAEIFVLQIRITLFQLEDPIFPSRPSWNLREISRSRVLRTRQRCRLRLQRRSVGVYSLTSYPTFSRTKTQECITDYKVSTSRVRQFMNTTRWRLWGRPSDPLRGVSPKWYCHTAVDVVHGAGLFVPSIDRSDLLTHTASTFLGFSPHLLPLTCRHWCFRFVFLPFFVIDFVALLRFYLLSFDVRKWKIPYRIYMSNACGMRRQRWPLPNTFFIFGSVWSSFGSSCSVCFISNCFPVSCLIVCFFESVNTTGCLGFVASMSPYYHNVERPLYLFFL